MYREVLQHLQLCEGLVVMDGTVGAGGHSQLIRKQLGDSGRLIGFDRDPMMLNFAAEKLPESNVTLVHSSYVDAERVLSELGVSGVDRVLLDLGLSSDQLSDRQRGFGFDAGGPLDMRFDIRHGRSAAEFLRTADESEITDVLTRFGEEPHARQIARQICRSRGQQPLETSEDLQELVRSVGSVGGRGSSFRNPATRVFQALRIAVNHELDHVEQMFTDVLSRILNPGGIVVVLTFHSLEDRIVKSAFKGSPEWQVLTKTPIEATPAEIRLNPRSRSAKLRAAKRKLP